MKVTDIKIDLNAPIFKYADVGLICDIKRISVTPNPGI